MKDRVHILSALIGGAFLAAPLPVGPAWAQESAAVLVDDFSAYPDQKAFEAVYVSAVKGDASVKVRPADQDVRLSVKPGGSVTMVHTAHTFKLSGDDGLALEFTVEDAGDFTPIRLGVRSATDPGKQFYLTLQRRTTPRTRDTEVIVTNPHTGTRHRFIARGATASSNGDENLDGSQNIHAAWRLEIDATHVSVYRNGEAIRRDANDRKTRNRHELDFADYRDGVHVFVALSRGDKAKHARSIKIDDLKVTGTMIEKQGHAAPPEPTLRFDPSMRSFTPPWSRSPR